MDKDALLQANKNLSIKITKVEKENHELWRFKERFFDLEKYTRELEKRLETKREVIKVYKLMGNIKFALRVTKVEDSPEGMYIEVDG